MTTGYSVELALCIIFLNVGTCHTCFQRHVVPHSSDLIVMSDIH